MGGGGGGVESDENDEFNRDDDANDWLLPATPTPTPTRVLWIAPVAEMNADARLLLLLPPVVDVAAANTARLENRMLADAAVANEKTSGDEKRI